MKKILFCIINFFAVGFIGFCLVDYRAWTTQGVYVYFTPIKWYIAAFAIALIISIPLGILEYKFEYYEKFFSALKNCRKQILSLFAILLSSGIIAVITEIVLSKFLFGTMSTGKFFNIYRFWLIFAICFVVEYIVYAIVSNNIKVENLFAVIALSAGSVMILSAPFAHISWDVDSHYKTVVAQSNLYGLFTKADHDVVALDADYLLNNTVENNAQLFEKNEEKYNQNDKAVFNNVEIKKICIARMPASIAVAVCRFFRASFVTKMNCAKFINLIVYTLICYLAIRKLKTGKMIMFVIALFPTNIFLAATISYDWWVNSFIMLGMAIFLSEMQQPDKPIKPIESIAMCGSLCLACLPKQVYFPVLIIPFLLKKSYFKVDKKSKRIHYVICVFALTVLVLSFMSRLGGSVSSGGDSRGGEGINSIGQISFIFSNPLKYTGILLKFLSSYLSFEGASGYMCSFAYLGIGFGYAVLLILLITAVITDKNEYDIFTSKIWMKIFFVILAFGTVCLVATSLYIDYNTVGLNTIKGCQPRYLIPILIFLLPVIGSCKFKNKIDKRIYNSFFAISSSAILFTDIYQCMVARML